jgi:hypothetical protein
MLDCLTCVRWRSRFVRCLSVLCTRTGEVTLGQCRGNPEIEIRAKDGKYDVMK